ncbi:MAG: DUF3363 domain-containing protein [Burkholderiales bacterium]
MSESEDTRHFRLRPRKARQDRANDKVPGGFLRLMQLFRATAKQAGGGSARRSGRPPKPASQRCAVRVSYSPNKTKGQWRAHGRYLERDSAIGENRPFGKDSAQAGLSERLGEWQSSRDPRLFKLILSPEFGERLDLCQFTRDFMARLEERIGAPLEWVAVVHNNTEHPHVHVALRGVAAGRELRLDKNLIRSGMREEAERLCTRALGYRTSADIAQAQNREVDFARPTSLDRYIDKGSSRNKDADLVYPLYGPLNELGQLLSARLGVLAKMGLAKPNENGWVVRRDFLQVLKAMQQAGDRQKMLQQYGILMSDPRLPTVVTRLEDIESLEGRVLAHVHDDMTGKPQMILEGTDGKVHFIRYTPAMERLRADGHLKPNHFVSFESISSKLRIEDHGDAETHLHSDRLRQAARRLIQRGVLPTEIEYGGWLGRYHKAVANPVEANEPGRLNRAALPAQEKERSKEQGR